MIDYKKLFRLAKEKGVEDIQIAFDKEVSKEISYHDKELNSFTVNTNSYFSCKGIYKGHMGSYSTEVIDDSQIETIINKVIESAKYITNNDEVLLYEGSDHYEKIPNEYNEELSKISIQDKMNKVFNINSLMLEKANVVHSSCDYAETEDEFIMANSKGLFLSSHSNSFYVYVSSVVEKDNDTRNSYAVFEGNDFNLIDDNKLINEAYDEVYNSIGASPIPSGNYETIFSERATGTLISCFDGIFSSSRAQKDLSILKGRVGEKIGSDVVTLVDNPLLFSSMSSKVFDSDGVATNYKEIIKDGVFTDFVYNLKTGKKENRGSTGNAIGSGAGLLLPYFKPGKNTLDEMIKNTKSGLYITSLQGANAGANDMSCDFSLQAKGFIIEEGRLTKPVALITVSSNFLDVLKNIEEVSSEIKNAIDSTAIRVKSISVSGV